MWTIPNLLTAMRLAGLPVVIGLSRAGHPFAAALTFVLAMATDCVDGYLARRLNQVSRFGLYLDPVVDKIVVLAMCYELARVGALSWWVPHLFLTRELLQNAVRSVAASQGTVVGANRMGKTKAFLQIVLITWALLLPWIPGVFPDVLVPFLTGAVPVQAWFLVLLTWGFFAEFVRRNRRVLV